VASPGLLTAQSARIKQARRLATRAFRRKTGRFLVEGPQAVREPGNVGTLIRTADAAGADAVVLSSESVDPHNPKAVRASVGSIFHVPISTDVDVPAAAPAWRDQGLQVLAADGYGSSDLDDCIDDGTLTKPTVWLFGNEAHGLPDGYDAFVDRSVKVPIYGRAESLNLATAAAICLYASARAQRR
jgi:TrmH family RNA methyltransferase